MPARRLEANQTLQHCLDSTAAYIERTQLSSGAIPWFEGGIIDPWDHVEGIMGLAVAGRFEQARAGFEWLANQQLDDGAWYAAYQDTASVDSSRKETNFVAYPATGLWHYYLASGDVTSLRDFWPVVVQAMNWVTHLQTDEGEIFWAVDTEKGISEDALVTGCSSIYKSLECTARIAQVLGQDPAPWLAARERLGHTLRHKPHRFDRTWPSKERYAMDWFYPVLTGVLSQTAAQARLDQRWSAFVEASLGCRCVVEEPWVTVAETCELIMACVCANRLQEAEQLFKNLLQF